MVDFDSGREERMREHLLTGGPAHGGVTVRDYFAAKAMQSLIEKMDETPFDVADEAYDFADAMLERRSGRFDAKVSPTVEEAFGLDK